MAETRSIDKATELVDAVLRYRLQNRWLLPGTRELLIEAAVHNIEKNALLDALEAILTAGEIDDPGSDPCDECRHDKWFYFHPAMVL